MTPRIWTCATPFRRRLTFWGPGKEEAHLVERYGDKGRRGVAADHVDFVEQRPDEDFERVRRDIWSRSASWSTL